MVLLLQIVYKATLFILIMPYTLPSPASFCSFHSSFSLTIRLNSSIVIITLFFSTVFST